MTYLNRIDDRLDELGRRDLRRNVLVESEFAAGVLLDFSSNDYLGLSQHPSVVAAFQRANRAGSGGSRLLAGAFREHKELEDELAEFVGREASLIFSSGYNAALGAIGAIARVVATCYSDALNHACLIDGLRNTRLVRHIYAHGRFADTAHERQKTDMGALVVTESVFGVDGDCVNVREILSAMGSEDVLFVDEAHALGVVGSHGRGVAYGLADPRILVMGTLSKAFGTLGGFVAGPRRAIAYLQSAARTFIFDTALPPAVAEAARVAVRLARDCDAERAKLHDLAKRLRSGLRALGYAVPEGIGPVVPVIVGEASETLALAARLRKFGIHAPPVRPPTVPPGTSRLRVTLRATHCAMDVDRLLSALAA